jgi:hypothetical protein
VNLITTLYNEELKELDNIPSSKKVEYVYVGQELLPDNNASIFGKKVYIVYVYGGQDIKKLFTTLERLNPFILAVDPLSYLSITRLASDLGIEHQVAKISESGFVKWMQSLFPSAPTYKCMEVSKEFNLNVWSVYHSRESIARYMVGAIKLKDIKRTLPLNFARMLLYIVGDPTIKKEDYFRSVVKYRLAIKKFRKASRKALKNYINSVVDGTEPDRMSRKLANFITLEGALLLYEEMAEITVPQLFRK